MRTRRETFLMMTLRTLPSPLKLGRLAGRSLPSLLLSLSFGPESRHARALPNHITYYYILGGKRVLVPPSFILFQIFILECIEHHLSANSLLNNLRPHHHHLIIPPCSCTIVRPPKPLSRIYHLSSNHSQYNSETVDSQFHFSNFFNHTRPRIAHP